MGDRRERVRAPPRGAGEPVGDRAAIESETRRGRDYVRIRVSVTIGATDLGQAAVAAWGVFREAAGGDLAAWDLAAASAEIQPEEKARLTGPPHPALVMADPASMGVVAGPRGTAFAAALRRADSGGRARSNALAGRMTER
jgi:hypothetical protein